MAGDYIPPKNTEFNLWQIQFVDGLLTDPVTGLVTPFPPAPGADPANWVNWGIPQPDMQELIDAQAAYQPLYDAWTDEDARNRDKEVAHKEGRRIYEKFVRDFVAQWLRNNKKLNDAAKAFLGLTVPDTEPTAVTPVNYGPVLSFDVIRPLYQQLRVADPEHPTSQAMPKGHKLVLERFVGDAGLQMEDIPWTVYKEVGKFLISSEFTVADQGKTVFYRARYITTRGDYSPFGNTLVMGIV